MSADPSAPLDPATTLLPNKLVAITGATGLIGSALSASLSKQGYSVAKMVRRAAQGPDEIAWDPEAGTVDAEALSRVGAVVHLAGENIGEGKWKREKMRRIRESRVRGTQILCEAIARLERPPRTLISGSAIGYYGSRGDQELDERASPGDDFLAQVCRDWEAATQPAQQAGVRVVNLRTGVVLSTKGGGLAKMLTPFRLGLGGVVGNGRQWMSWIVLDDVVRAIEHALANEALAGPMNAVAPHPVTNREFTKTLGRVLGRPTIFPLPAFVARLAFGKMADALLLSSTRVVPQRLAETGFRFEYPELEGGLQHVLGQAG